ncbi:MAG: hypothetical protein ACT4UQ_10350 [Gammaproteobacteria bacterium]
MNGTALRLFAPCALALLAGCQAQRVATQAQLPPPLVDRQPARVGIYYSKEFREYVHKETRGQVDYEVTLGPAHVTNLDWLLQAMFAEIVPVEDPTRVAELRPPLVLVLEPRFEEYSFLTPKDVAGEAFIVTIRYLLTVYDGNGGRVDSITYTGYGREPGRALGSREPLQIATQRAMRDAGAKLAVELPEQESIRLLLRHPFSEREQAQVQSLPAVPAAQQAPAPQVSPPGEAAPAEKPAEPAAEPPPRPPPGG